MDPKMQAIADLRSHGRVVAVEIKDYCTIPTNVNLLVDQQVRRHGLLGWLGLRASQMCGVKGWKLGDEPLFDDLMTVLGEDGVIYLASTRTNFVHAFEITDEQLAFGDCLKSVQLRLSKLDDEHIHRRK